MTVEADFGPIQHAWRSLWQFGMSDRVCHVLDFILAEYLSSENGENEYYEERYELEMILNSNRISIRISKNPVLFQSRW